MPNNVISTRISLGGAEEIKRILADLGATGERAFAQIREAVDQANSRLKTVSAAVADAEKSFAQLRAAGANFGQSFNNLGGSIQNFGGAVAATGRRIAIFAAGVAAVGTGVALFARSATQAADELGETSTALGLSSDAYQRLEFAATQAGVKQEQFGTAMRFLTRIVVTEAQTQKAALADFARSLETSVNAPNIRTVTQQARIDFQQIAEVAQRVQQQLRAAGIDQPLHLITERLREMATGTEKTRQQFELLAGEALQGGNAALRKLGIEGEKSVSVLQRLGVRATDAAGNMRSAEDVIADIADAIAKLPPGFERTRRVIELFGEESGTRLLPLLEQGGAALRQLGRDFERTGLQITTAQIRLGDSVENSLFFLGRTVSLVRTQLGLLFAPSLKAGADLFREAIIANFGTMREFGESIARFVNPLLIDLAELLLGRSQDIEPQNWWLFQLQETVTALGRSVQQAVTGIIIPAFRALFAVLNTAADAINRVFGTEFSGQTLLVAAVIARLLGLFRILGTTILVAVTAVRTLGLGLVFLFRSFQFGAAAVRAIGIALAAIIPSGFFATLGTARTAVVGLVTLLGVSFVRAVALAAGALIAFARSNRWLIFITLAGVAVDELIKAFQRLQGNLSGGGTGLFDPIIRQGEALVDSLTGLGRTTEEIGQQAQRSIRGIHDVQTELQQLNSRNIPGISDLPQTFERSGQSAQKFGQELSTTKQQLDDVAIALNPPLSPEENLFAVPMRTALAFLPQIQRIRDALSSLGEAIRNALITPAGAATAGGAGTETQLQLLGIDPVAMRSVLEQIRIAAQTTFSQIALSVPNLWAAITAGFRAGAATTSNIFNSMLREAVAAARQAGPEISAAFNGIAQSITGSLGHIPAFVGTVSNQVTAIVREMLGNIRQAAAETIEALNEVIRTAQRAAEAGGGGGGGGGSGFASGGFVRGPGTSTSDSILARLSSGEFVIRAAAVEHFGKDFFAALNALRMPGFSVGGLVDGFNRSLAGITAPLLIPGFADGGMVPAIANRSLGELVLKSDTGKVIGRVFTDDATVQNITRYATLSRLRSAGRKPSADS